jgi:hypothetical protein
LEPVRPLPAPECRSPVTTQDKSRHPHISPLHAESSLLLQFVLLSMLLHLLVVLLFGTATSGGARRGDGWMGPLDVTLRQLSPERGAGFTLAPGADVQQPGAALLRRMEGATAAPVALPQSRASAPAEPPETANAAAPPVPSPPPAEVREAVPEISLSPRPPPVDALPRLDRTAPEEVDKPLVAPAVATPKAAPPPAEREAPPREFALPPMAPLERIVPPKVDRQLAPPIELRPREVPAAPRAPPVEFKPSEEATPAPAPVEKSPPAKVEHEQAPPLEVKPREVPMPAIAPLERIAPAAIERNLAPQTELTAPRVPVEAAAPARVAPAREAAPAVQPAPRSAPAAAAPASAPGRQAPLRTETPAPGEPQRLRFGAPGVDDEVFGNKRDAPAAETGAPPAVTVESMKKRAREIATEGSGSRGVLNLIPPPPPVERRDKLAEDIAKAAKPDCRTAYAGMGLLAVVPLVASSVSSNGGCNW